MLNRLLSVLTCTEAYTLSHIIKCKEQVRESENCGFTPNTLQPLILLAWKHSTVPENGWFFRLVRCMLVMFVGVFMPASD